MPREEVFSGSVDHLQVLDKDGNVDEELEPDLDDDTLQEMYRLMVLGRRFDEKAVSLQRQGRIGTFPPLKGQEAAQAGSGLALEEDDWFVPSYREHIVNMARDTPLDKILLYWGGDERGSQKEGRNLPESVPVGSQLPHAAGIGMGTLMDDEAVAALTYCGDGATSEGAFHSGLNWAGTYELPVVFFVQNNQYAISVPREEQTGAETIAQKALGYGVDGIQVDGNDPLAVYKATTEALERAREEGRPTLIEAVTYRRENHTTADDASKYRDEEEVAYWRDRDPIERFETYLKGKGLLDERLMEDGEFREDKADVAIYQEVDDVIREAVEAYEEVEEQPIDDMFDYHFAELPPELERQRERAQERNRGED